MSHTVHKLRRGRWIEIRRPSPEDIKFLESEFSFLHPLNLEDSLERVDHAKMDLSQEYLFLSLAVPVDMDKNQRLRNFEVSMFLMKDALVTVAHTETDLFREEMPEEPGVMVSSQALAYRLLDLLYEKSDRVVAAMAAQIQSIDDRILSARSPYIIREIAILQRNLVYFSTTMEAALPHFKMLGGTGLPFTRSAMKEYWDDLADRLVSQRDALSDQEILLGALGRAHEMFVTHRTNHIVSILTLFSAVFLPLTLISGIYGMNFVHLPLQENPEGFFLIIGFMAVVAVVLLAYFKLKKWI